MATSDMPEVGPESQEAGIDFDNPALKSYINAIQDIKSFLGPEIPNSVAADKQGLATADFLLENADLVKAVEVVRAELEAKANKKIVTWLFGRVNIKMTQFQNWAGNLDESNGLMLYAKPKNTQQVQGVIKAAGEMNPMIKVGFGGAYHSWSPLFPEKCNATQMSIILNMCDMYLSSILPPWRQRIRLNRDQATNEITHVTIAPGVTTGELMEVFLDEGVCFESDVILLNVTYGGVIPTACHGVGKDQTVLADWVSEVKIVDVNGDLKTYPQDLPSEDQEEYMKAIRMSMGVFGAVVEMTVKVEKLKTAKLDTSYPTVGTLLYGDAPTLPRILRENWSVEILWFPFNSLGLVGGLVEGLPLINLWQPKRDEVWVRVINRDDSHCEADKFEKLKQKIFDTLQHQAFGTVVNPVIERYHTLTPAIIGSATGLVKIANPPGISYEPMPYGIHFRYGISLGPAYDMEFGFPFNLYQDDAFFDNLMNAMRFVVDKSKEYSTRGYLGALNEYPLSTTMELRVVNKSDCLLCPASRRSNDGGTTHTAYLEILSFLGTTSYEEFYKEVGEEWMRLGGAPHWCKQWTFLEGNPTNVFDHVNTFYGENITKYREVLQSQAQKDGQFCDMFVNSTMKKLLSID